MRVYETGTDLVGPTAELSPEGRVIVAYVLGMFGLDSQNAAHVSLVTALLRASEAEAGRGL